MKHLLQYFTELSLHPKNAEELKGLILQLAVQGKLTAKWREENPGVEPATVLLERIKEEKAQLVKEKKIRKEKPLPEITDNEIPFDLPKSWAWSRLGGVIKISSGKGLTSANMDKTGVIPVYGGNGITGYHNSGNVNKETIVIGRVGFYCGSIHLTEKKAWITDNAFITQFSEANIYRDYLLLLLRGTNLKEDENATAQPVISGRKVYPIIVALPPLEEQKAIVKTVHQLFTEVEQLENLTKERIQLKEDFVTSALHQLSTGDTTTEWAFLQQHFATFFTEESNIKKLRESILQLAVQGKLTRHWRKQNPEVEPASVLLERIQEEKAQLVKAKKIKKEKPLPEIGAEELPYDLPVGWVWCRLGEISEFINGDRSKNYPNKSEYVENGVAWINTGHINPNGTLSKSRMNYITRAKFDSLRSGKIQDGDMVYCLRGATFGKTAFVTPFNEGAIASSLMIIRGYLKELGGYMYRYLISPEGKKQLLRFDNGSAQPNLSANKVRLYVFPLPPYEEQKPIVEKVNILLALCDQLAQAIQSSKATQEDWMQSSLREVFEVEVATTQ